MAQIPTNSVHEAQISSGTYGRQRGHAFESRLAEEINRLPYPYRSTAPSADHIIVGNPAVSILNCLATHEGFCTVRSASAVATGTLATSEDGQCILTVDGKDVSRSKSDVIVTLHSSTGARVTVGVSTKSCSKPNPTNDQLYFTTARSFSETLVQSGIPISDKAIVALRQFCGDNGFRPLDDAAIHADRKIDPRRYFWEEIDEEGKKEWERIFTKYQDHITRILLCTAYQNDPFPPKYLIHKTKSSATWDESECAVYLIEELLSLSKQYQGFVTKSYSVRKGSYKDPAGVAHLAPRFGIVQMQRAGTKQNGNQLQFNLEAGYFYKLDSLFRK